MAELPLIVDGHVHITNRVYWEGLDPWQPQRFGFDYAQASAAGVRVIIENVGTYGYANYNYTPKQTLRLIEAFHRSIEEHEDRMGLALSGADARRIVDSGRMAVFLGVEAGFDHEGDCDVLRALYRLGLRSVQFSTQSCFNAFADAEVGGNPVWGGINDRGRALIATMNELGMLIDITHATPGAQAQIVAVSEAPVVASHIGFASIAGDRGGHTGLLSDDVLRAVASKGGMVGIIGAASTMSARFREWMVAHPERASEMMAGVAHMVSFDSPLMRAPLNHGEYGDWLDEQMRAAYQKTFVDKPHAPGLDELIPTPDEWAAHVAHAIRTVGAEHVGIGLDLAAGHYPCVPINAAGYPALIEALRQITDEHNVHKIAGENWLRVLDAVL
jgi:membrane dipeptidase